MTRQAETNPVIQAVRDDLIEAGVCDGRVYDEVPAGVTHPYVDVGNSQTLPANHSTARGAIDFLTLHIWSEHAGGYEARVIADQMRPLFDDVQLVVPDQCVLCWIDDVRVDQDVDGKRYHGTVILRIEHTTN